MTPVLDVELNKNQPIQVEREKMYQEVDHYSLHCYSHRGQYQITLPLWLKPNGRPAIVVGPDCEVNRAKLATTYVNVRESVLRILRDRQQYILAVQHVIHGGTECARETLPR